MLPIIDTDNKSKLLWKIALAVWVFIAICGVIYKIRQEPPVATVTQDTTEKESVFLEELKPIYSNPIMVKVASVSIETPIITVGLDAAGSLEAPKEWNKGGWYKKSSQPGEKGNMIINGHYDDNFGRPAAFWQLKNIKVNDTVDVIDEFGKTYSYTITESFYLDINDPNRLKIFDNDSSKSSITLITCGGVWLPSAHNYNKRLVIKGEFVK